MSSDLAFALRGVDTAVGGDFALRDVSFELPAGSYTCLVLVKELATGNFYAESVDFEVH